MRRGNRDDSTSALSVNSDRLLVERLLLFIDNGHRVVLVNWLLDERSPIGLTRIVTEGVAGVRIGDCRRWSVHLLLLVLHVGVVWRGSLTWHHGLSRLPLHLVAWHKHGVVERH